MVFLTLGPWPSSFLPHSPPLTVSRPEPHWLWHQPYTLLSILLPAQPLLRAKRWHLACQSGSAVSSHICTPHQGSSTALRGTAFSRFRSQDSRVRARYPQDRGCCLPDTVHHKSFQYIPLSNWGVNNILNHPHLPLPIISLWQPPKQIHSFPEIKESRESHFWFVKHTVIETKYSSFYWYFWQWLNLTILKIPMQPPFRIHRAKLT